MPWCSTNQLLLSGPKRRIFILTSLLGLQSQAGGYTIAPSQKGTDVTPRSQAPCDRMGVVQKVQLPLVKFLSRLLSALVSHPGTGQEQVVALAASCPHPRELPEWVPATNPPHTATPVSLGCSGSGVEKRPSCQMPDPGPVGTGSSHPSLISRWQPDVWCNVFLQGASRPVPEFPWVGRKSVPDRQEETEVEGRLRSWWGFLGSPHHFLQGGRGVPVPNTLPTSSFFKRMFLPHLSHPHCPDHDVLVQPLVSGEDPLQ